jgi:hypothetical protein
MDNKLKHLEFIQSVISRMAGNSFLLKGWSVTLAAALFALAAKDANHRLILLAYYPVLVFWILDGYFLSQERRYRALYDEVRQLTAEDINFSMDTRSLKKGRNRWGAATLSNTLMLFYGAVLLAMLLVSYLLFH